jgi:hypothetical protein
LLPNGDKSLIGAISVLFWGVMPCQRLFASILQCARFDSNVEEEHIKYKSS